MYRVSFIVDGGPYYRGAKLLIENGALTFRFLGKQILRIPFEDIISVSYGRVFLQIGEWIALEYSGGSVNIYCPRKNREELFGILSRAAAN
ncbi:MAG: hypothetical protein IJV00_00145 [Clostridia bacterium]|nr:hypothetical protein [Clostridia bacterium]